MTEIHFLITRKTAPSLAFFGAVVLALAPGCANSKNSGPPSAPAPATVEQPSTVFGQAAPPVATPPVLAGTPDIASLVESVQPTVVNITTSATVTSVRTLDPFEFFFGPEGFGSQILPPEFRMPEQPSTRQSQSLGSGFVIDSDGYVVTNNHVIERADEVVVRFADDRSFDAKVVGRDSKLDVALLELQGATGLTAAVLGDSDALRVGEYVVAVGNPFGLGHTVTMGIVSAKDRTIGAGPYDDFIQTDASINPGNSGGPLFNLRGEIVGINTAIHRQGQGIGFAIPINMVREAVLQLKEKGHVSRGKLGITFQAVTEEIAKAMGLARPRGALVAEVEPKGPADRAGLQSGDLIIDVNGVELIRSQDLPRLVARNAPGSTVRITYVRTGKQHTASVVLDALEAETKGIERSQKGKQSSTSKFGLTTESTSQGVRITGVTGNLQGKLSQGDLIESVDSTRTTTPDQVFAALAAAKRAGRPALVKVRRGERTLFVPIHVTE